MRRRRLAVSRRSVLHALLQGAALGVCGPLSARVAERFVAPDGSGDGSSWPSAAPVQALPALVRAVGPGGVVNVRADADDVYRLGRRSLALRHGGAPGAPVRIRGVRRDGAPAVAVFESDRTRWSAPEDPEQVTDVRGWAPGASLFRLLKGADHLAFERLEGRHAGAVLNCEASLTGVSVLQCRGLNVRRWLELARGVSMTDILIDGLEVVGFSKQCIRCRGDSRRWLIRNVKLNSARQDRDDFAVGIQFDDTAHDVRVEGAELSNCHDSGRAYHNGDGGSSEVGNYDIEWRDVRSFGHTDAGLDNKGACVYRNVECHDNKIGLRFWAGAHTARGVVVRDSRMRGGTGRPALLGVYGSPGPSVVIEDLQARQSTQGSVFLFSGEGARVSVERHAIELSGAATLQHGLAAPHRLNLSPPL